MEKKHFSVTNIKVKHPCADFISRRSIRDIFVHSDNLILYIFIVRFIFVCVFLYLFVVRDLSIYTGRFSGLFWGFSATVRHFLHFSHCGLNLKKVWDQWSYLIERKISFSVENQAGCQGRDRLLVTFRAQWCCQRLIFPTFPGI